MPRVAESDDRRSRALVHRRAGKRDTSVTRGSLWIVPDLWKTLEP